MNITAPVAIPFQRAIERLSQLKLGLATKLETLSLYFQAKAGLRSLVEFTQRSPFRHNHVFLYQTMIRRHVAEWPCTDNWIAVYRGFMERYERTTLDYFKTGAKLYFDLGNGEDADPFLIFQNAVLSEAGRFREGKRSQIGLDQLQESLVTQIEQLLIPIWRKDLGSLDETLNGIFQSLPWGYSSSSEIDDLFAAYVEKSDQVLTADNVEAIDAETEGLASRILRGYSAYSCERFNTNLVRCRNSVQSHVQRRARARANFDRIAARVAHIASLLKPEEAEMFSDSVAQALVLNFCNDYLDVKFSFKSFVGLVHYHAFDLARAHADPAWSLREMGTHLAQHTTRSAASTDLSRIVQP